MPAPGLESRGYVGRWGVSPGDIAHRDKIANGENRVHVRADSRTRSHRFNNHTASKGHDVLGCRTIASVV